MSKVQFNIKNIHVALQKTGVETTGEITFEKPFRVPGAVSLSVEPQGETTAFYADGIEYYSSNANTGYKGDIEVAIVTDEFREKILKEELDSKNVLLENQNTDSVSFALGFEIDGDEKGTKFWFYNCKASRPKLSAKTNETSKTPQTDSLEFSATGLPVIAGSDDYIVRAKTSDQTVDAEMKKWFDTVYVPTRTVGA